MSEMNSKYTGIDERKILSEITKLVKKQGVLQGSHWNNELQIKNRKDRRVSIHNRYELLETKINAFSEKIGFKYDRSKNPRFTRKR